jgi:hypothetical protein
MVFDNTSMPAHRVEANCWDTIAPWANRSRRADHREALANWAAANRPM